MSRSNLQSRSGWKAILLATAMLLGGISFFPGVIPRAEAQLAGKEVLIGATWGLTGMWRDYTTKNVIAAQIAIEEINAAGGIKGLPLRLITYDTGGKPMEAPRMLRKLATDDKALAIIGPFSTSEAEVAFPVANNLRIIMTPRPRQNRVWPRNTGPMPSAIPSMRLRWERWR